MISGPGLKQADVRTLEYLREVAIQAAKGLADGTTKKSPRKLSLVDKVRCVVLGIARLIDSKIKYKQHFIMLTIIN